MLALSPACTAKSQEGFDHELPMQCDSACPCRPSASHLSVLWFQNAPALRCSPSKHKCSRPHVRRYRLVSWTTIQTPVGRVKQVDALNYLDKANAEIDMDEINGTFSQQPIMFRPGGQCPVVSKQQIPVSFMLKYSHVSSRC